MCGLAEKWRGETGMKKRGILLVQLWLLLTVLLVGCGKAETEETETSSSSVNLFKQAETDDNSPGIGTEVSIKDEKVSYTYRGEDISIPYQYRASGFETVGLLVLCDGIVTPYYSPSADGTGALQQCHIFSLNGNDEQQEIDICFTPIGRKGETVDIQVIDIPDAAYSPSEEELENMGEFVVKAKYRTGYISGLTVRMEQDGARKDISESKSYTREKIPARVLRELSEKNEDGTVSNQLDYLYSFAGMAEHRVHRVYRVKKGEVITVPVQIAGTEGSERYIAFFCDNQLYPAFDGNEYMKCKVDKKHYTEFEAVFDTSNWEPGCHLLYSIWQSDPYCSTSPVEWFFIVVE